MVNWLVASSLHPTLMEIFNIANEKSNIGNVQATLRNASEQDLPAIKRIVRDAYEGYIPRIGGPPAPMTDDYQKHVTAGHVWVLLLDNQIVALMVLVPKPDYMLLDNIAVAPGKQRQGFGSRLMYFAEARARQCAYKEVQLYTNERMHENIAFYKGLGYEETARRVDSGFKRVFMKKTL